MVALHSILMFLYVAFVLYAAWSDARELHIPNWVSLALLAAFLPIAVIADLGLETIAWHGAAGLLLLAAGFTLYALGYFGGGDAKLMAVCALWVGWDTLFLFILVVLLVGGVLSILVILLRLGLGIWPTWLVSRAQGIFTPNKAVPYGIAIAVGAMITLPKMDVLPSAWQVLFKTGSGLFF